MALRRLGVYSENLPTKKGQTVQASDFSIAGLIGHFERKFDKAYPVRSPQEAQKILGAQIYSSQYGWDALNGFFQNLGGVAATLYVVAHIGYTGTAIDAVTAHAELDDTQTSPADILKLEDAYQGQLGYGISGNRTGYKCVLGTRFGSTCATTGTKDDTWVDMVSVAGVRAGDIMKLVATGGGGATVWKKITTVDEAQNRVNFAGVFHATANMAAGDVCEVPGFKVEIYRKALNGAVVEVEQTFGDQWMTTEPEVTEFYANNVFAAHPWVKATILTTTPPTLDQKLPAAVSAITYLASGADGTAPTTSAHWSRTLTRFDNLPVRILANCETTDQAIQKAIETYCKARSDNPKTLYNVPEDRTKAQLITIGNYFQRADDVLGVLVAHWLLVQDPFNTAALAPGRHVPNVGHAMGLWLRSIGTRGVHWIPATRDMPLYGVIGIVGEQFASDFDRTDLANAGVNVIQEIAGAGIVVRNWFTPSTTKEFMFGNGLLMREYIKAAAIDSLQGSENQPNTLDRIQADAAAIYGFLSRLWRVGSTGNSPEGEFFGKSFAADGSETKPEDHFQVQADVVNNPVSSIEAGMRNIDCWFSFPSPAGSIKIAVGILLRG